MIVRYLIEESCEHDRFGKHITDYDDAGDTFCLTKPVVVTGENVDWCVTHGSLITGFGRITGWCQRAVIAQSATRTEEPPFCQIVRRVLIHTERMK